MLAHLKLAPSSQMANRPPRRRSTLAVAAALTALSAPACEQLIGLDNPTLEVPTTTNTTTSGEGGSGGGGGSSGMACVPETTMPCYEGPPNTEDIGVCLGGTQTCAPDGSAFGACENQVLPTPESCKDETDENCDGFDCAIWSKAFGGDSTQSASALAVDADGNIYIAGYFSGSIDLGGGPLMDAGTGFGAGDVFLAKLDPNGNHVWSKRFGDNTQASIFSTHLAVTDTGEVFFAGPHLGMYSYGGAAISGPGFIAKFSADGTHLWSKSYPAAILSLAVDQQEAIVTGAFNGTINLGQGALTSQGADIFLARIGADGTGIWSKKMGGPGSDASPILTLADSGDIILGGRFTGEITFDQTTVSSPDMTMDLFVARLNSLGEPGWIKLIETAANAPDEKITSVAVDFNGDVAAAVGVTGTAVVGGVSTPHAGSSDIVLVSWSALGDQKWVKHFGSPTSDIAGSVSFAEDNHLFVTARSAGDISFGGSPLTAAGALDALVVRLDGLGNHVWSKRFGDAMNQSLGRVASTADGLVAVGEIEGTTDFGAGPLVAPDADAVVVKLGK